MEKEPYKPTVLPAKEDPANPDNWEYDANMQGFPGQVYSRKLTEKQKGWIVIAKITFWGVLAWTIIKYLIL